jgi:hypothetical protein
MLTVRHNLRSSLFAVNVHVLRKVYFNVILYHIPCDYGSSQKEKTKKRNNGNKQTDIINDGKYLPPGTHDTINAEDMILYVRTGDGLQMNQRINSGVPVYLLFVGGCLAAVTYDTILLFHMRQYFMNGLNVVTSFTNSNVCTFLIALALLMTGITIGEGNPMMRLFDAGDFKPLFDSFKMTLFAVAYCGSNL